MGQHEDIARLRQCMDMSMDRPGASLRAALGKLLGGADPWGEVRKGNQEAVSWGLLHT